MNTYSFVQLSDIHFGQERDGEFIEHHDVRAEIIRDCKTLSRRSELGRATGVLVGGDTAYSGKEAEYDRAGNWLDELTSAVGLSRIDVAVIPGNHDIDIARINSWGRLAHQNFRGLTEYTHIDNQLRGLAQGPETENHLLHKLAEYRVFASRYGCDFESIERPIWTKDFSFGKNTLRLMGLNSVQVSDKSDAQANMVLGSRQYIIPNEDNVEYIVLIHHPLHWFIDRVRAKNYLKRARVLMFGHEHNLEVRKLTENDGSERLEVMAGAVTPPEQGGVYQYRYNWLVFGLEFEDGTAKLRVTIFPRIWNSDRSGFVADVHHCGGAESSTQTLICPNFTVEVPSSASHVSLPTQALADTCDSNINLDTTIPKPFLDSGLGQVTDIALREEPAVTLGQSDDFAQIRYLFWKHLDGPKRLQVLQEVGLLPASLSQPLTQTLERMALEKAKSQDKLSRLWTAVMREVPEGERQPNPFRDPLVEL